MVDDRRARRAPADAGRRAGRARGRRPSCASRTCRTGSPPASTATCRAATGAGCARNIGRFDVVLLHDVYSMVSVAARAPPSAPACRSRCSRSARSRPAAERGRPLAKVRFLEAVRRAHAARCDGADPFHRRRAPGLPRRRCRGREAGRGCRCRSSCPGSPGRARGAPDGRLRGAPARDQGHRRADPRGGARRAAASTVCGS